MALARRRRRKPAKRARVVLSRKRLAELQRKAEAEVAAEFKAEAKGRQRSATAKAAQRAAKAADARERKRARDRERQRGIREVRREIKEALQRGEYIHDISEELIEDSGVTDHTFWKEFRKAYK
jgi:hypothetical protein